jgi:hypothetical protein
MDFVSIVMIVVILLLILVAVGMVVSKLYRRAAMSARAPAARK